MKVFVGKRVNRLIIGAVIGSAILGIGGYSMSPKGKGFFTRLTNRLKSSFSFLKLGFSELKKKFKKNS